MVLDLDRWDGSQKQLVWYKDVYSKELI